MKHGHYERISGKNQYKKITQDWRNGYKTYTFYPATRTMVLNK
ncbi:MAG TPA: hypothetical protein VN922_17075 [Bacteroidia bacterium]|nr:hypothetical protein [Bacteroidia bacterium]